VIGERALTSLALVLHELATNAVKYGALSVGQGVVRVTWQIEADNLMLRWEERNGPGIEKTPTSEGFGSILVRRSIVGQLGGEVDYIWDGDSLIFCRPKAPRIAGRPQFQGQSLRQRPWSA
jgi:two-component system CheB/CheR fusion protein